MDSEFQSGKVNPPPYEILPPQQVQASAPPNALPNDRNIYMNSQPVNQPIFNIQGGGGNGLPNVGPDPARLNCPGCHEMIKTQVNTEYKTKAHLWALCLCFFLCWPCCCCPYCMQSCKIFKHKCPKCKTYIGTFDY